MRIANCVYFPTVLSSRESAPSYGHQSNGKATAMSALVSATTDATFETDVLKPSHELPVLVDFWAPWCGPCRTLGPFLEQIAAEFAGTLRVLKVNTDEAHELGTRYAIRSIPAVKLFRQGQVVAEFVGAQPLAQIRAFLAPHLPRASEAQRLAALELAAAGDTAAAREALTTVLRTDPDNYAAATDLARLQALGGDATAARATLEALPPVQQSAPIVLAGYALVHFAAQANKPSKSTIDSIRARVAGAILGGDIDSGVEALLSEMQSSPELVTAGGQDDLRQVFALLDPDDQRVHAWRRRLAALLH